MTRIAPIIASVGPDFGAVGGSDEVRRIIRCAARLHVARASRLVGIVDDDRDVHPVGDIELDEEAGHV